MQYVSLQQAEKETGKSRATLVRLCQKLQSTGEAIRDERGRWQISSDALKRFSNVTQSDAKKAKEPESVANDSMVQWLQSQLNEANSRIKELIYSNQLLINENKDLKQLEQPKEVGKVQTWLIILLCLAAFALIIYLTMV